MEDIGTASSVLCVSSKVYMFSQLKYLSLRERLLRLVVGRWLLTVNGGLSTTQ